MHAQHLLRPCGGCGHSVDIEVRGVARDHRLFGKRFVKAREDPRLEIEILVNRFHREIRAGQRGVFGGGRDQRHAAPGAARRQASAGLRTLEVPANHGEPFFKRLGVCLQHSDRDAGHGEVHGNAAAHGAAAHHRGPFHSPARRAAASLGRRPFGKEHVRKRLALRTPQALGKAPALLRQARAEIVAAGRRLLNALHDQFRRMPPAHPAGDPLARRGKRRAGLARFRQLARTAGNFAQGASFLKQLPGPSKGGFREVSVKPPIGKAALQRLGGRHRFALQAHAQGRLDTDQARGPLRAAGARQQPEMDFGEGEARPVRYRAVIAGQRQFEAAAVGHAADHRRDRLAAGIERIAKRGERGLGSRQLGHCEFPDVGAVTARKR